MSSRRLDLVTVAAPCQVPWSSMPGDERVRFCSQCRQKVYNLSDMTTAEAEALVLGWEGRLCVRFVRRADGTVLTRDCLGGRRVRRRRVAACVGLAVALVFGYFGWLASLVSSSDDPGFREPAWARQVEPFRTVLEWIDPTPTITVGACLPLPSNPGGGGPAGVNPPEREVPPPG